MACPRLGEKCNEFMCGDLGNWICNSSPTLDYKGYKANFFYSHEDKIYYGSIININDSVSFHSKNRWQIEDEFHKAVDDYIELCKSIGKEPKIGR